MAKFGKASKHNLRSCDPRLQRILEEVVKSIDCSVLEGHRGQAAQNSLYYATPRRTQVQWPKSKHNSLPSMAVDVVPYPVDWDDAERFKNFAHFVQGVAVGMGYKVRWGGDWDRDFDLKDNRFNDYPHFEIVEE